jgi:hypothetical protein
MSTASAIMERRPETPAPPESGREDSVWADDALLRSNSDPFASIHDDDDVQRLEDDMYETARGLERNTEDTQREVSRSELHWNCH